MCCVMVAFSALKTLACLPFHSVAIKVQNIPFPVLAGSPHVTEEEVLFKKKKIKRSEVSTWSQLNWQDDRNFRGTVARLSVATPVDTRNH